MNNHQDNEQCAISRASSAGERVETVDDFRRWARDELRTALPHASLACGHGRLHAAGVATDYVVLVDFPSHHLVDICNPAGGLDTPLMRRWLVNRTPVLFDPAVHRPWPEMSPAWLNRFAENDLRNAAVHACFDEVNFIGTYFSFHRLPEVQPAVHPQLLELLLKPLHQTLMRVINNVEAQERKTQPAWGELNQKEADVALWVARGKTNQDIAQIMHQSENTIKHHVTHVLQKLHLENRAQLAAAVARWPPGVITKGTKVL